MGDERLTRVSGFLRRVEDHRIVSVVILAGLVLFAAKGVVESIGQLVSASRSIYGFFRPSPEAVPPEERILSDTKLSIARYLGRDASSIKLNSARWTDLVGDGKCSEFLCDFEADEIRHTELYSMRSGNPHRLFSAVGYSQEAAVVCLGNMPHFLIWRTEGSGGYLTLNAFRWDGIGPLQRLPTPIDDGSSDAMFSGSLYFASDRVFLDGPSMKEEVISDGTKLTLVPYTVRPNPGDYGDNCHILRFDIRDDALEFKFDGAIIELERTGQDQYASKHTIEISMGESVLLDDNLGEPRAIRVLASGTDIEWRSGIFSVALFKKTGSTELIVNDSYGPWYELKFSVVPR
jgi:hypothetical protein